MDWIYNGSLCQVAPEGYLGFIYRIDYTDGSFYYGKKNILSTRKVPLGKKALAELTDKRLKKYKTVVKEVAWQRYAGSTKYSEGKTISSKTIIVWARTNKALRYLEEKLLFLEDVLFKPECLNMNIGGRYFDNVMEGGL